LRVKLEYSIWVAILIWAVFSAVPARYWFDPDVLYVKSYTRGEIPVEILFSRDVNHNFTGSYSVIVRDSYDTVVAEDGGGPFSYKKTAELPKDITLNWWASAIADDVRNLPVGLYNMETCWTVHSPFYMTPNKTVCVQSNVFEVTDAEQRQDI
jgi:hypothetical protein